MYVLLEISNVCKMLHETSNVQWNFNCWMKFTTLMVPWSKYDWLLSLLMYKERNPVECLGYYDIIYVFKDSQWQNQCLLQVLNASNITSDISNCCLQQVLLIKFLMCCLRVSIFAIWSRKCVRLLLSISNMLNLVLKA